VASWCGEHTVTVSGRQKVPQSALLTLMNGASLMTKLSCHDLNELSGARRSKQAANSGCCRQK